MSGIREMLANEATEAEARQEDPPDRMQRARTSGNTSQVYTVRMPVARLAELRAMAERSGEQPSALMRRWVLERLDAEQAHQPELNDVRRALTDALHTLDTLDNKRPA